MSIRYYDIIVNMFYVKCFLGGTGLRKRIYISTVGILIVLAVSFGGFQISKSRTFQFFGGIVQTINTQEKVVALTFDDGTTGKAV